MTAAPEPSLVDASQPLVLIAQSTRSGGTLLAQLLDGRPELHCHPPELKFGDVWPKLDLGDAPERLFERLHESSLTTAFEKGYSKDKAGGKLELRREERFPFELPPHAHRTLFLRLAARRPPKTQRDALDLYFTALFNAWKNNRNLQGAKRWTLVFRNRYREPANLAAFFADYPDGRFLTSVRDPKARTASFMRLHPDHKQTTERLVEKWKEATKDQIRALELYGDRALMVSFEQLLLATEPTMRRICDWLGIAFDQAVLTPTFNGAPIRANSSFAVEGSGILASPLESWRGVLSEAEAAFVDAETEALREQVLRFTTRI